MASEFVRKVKGIRNIDILSPNITTENDLISTIDGEVYVATNKGYRKITGIETKEIKQLKTDVSNFKIQSDTNTLTISDNTSEIETLKTSTGNNTSEIETLKKETSNWQKHKLTRNDGYISRIDNPDMEEMREFDKTGVYYIYHPENFLAGENGYMSIYSRSSSYSKAVFYPFNSEKIFSNTKYNGEWEGWQELTGMTRTVLFDGSSINTGDVITLNQSYKDFTELKIKVSRGNTNEIFNFDAEDETSYVISYINVFDNNSNGKLYEMVIAKKSPTELEIESQRSITISGDSSDDSEITILKIWGVK